PVDVSGAVSTTDVTWINSLGDIVAFFVSGGMPHAYVLHGTALTTIDYPGAQTTFRFGISNAGEVVGTEYTNDFFIAHGFLFSHGQFTLIDFPGARATWPTMAVDSRHIVGTYFGADGAFHGFAM